LNTHFRTFLMTFSTKRKPSQHIIFSVLIYLCFIGCAYGQEQNFKIPDSLKNKSSQELAKIIKKTSVGEATFYENIVLNFQRKDSLVVLYQELGRRFSKEENYKKAHKYLDKALVIATRNNNEEATCIISIIKANAYLLDGKNQDAIHFYDRAIAIAQKHEDMRLEIMATSSYMILLSQIDDQLERAFEIAGNLLKVLDRSPDKNTKNHVRILMNISDVFLEAQRYDDVLFYADKGIRIGDSLNYEKGLTDLYVKKGIAFYYKKEKEKSRYFLSKAMTLLEKETLENDFYQTVNVNYFLAKHYYDEALYDKAIDHLKTIVNTIKEGDNNKLPIIQSYSLLARCYRKKGDDKEAWHYNDLYAALHEAYQKNENKTRSRIFEREFSAQELELQKERTRTHLAQTNRRYAQIGLLVVLVMLGIVGYHFLRKQKKNKTLFNNLIDQIDQLESQNKNKEFQEKKKGITEISIDDDKVHAVLKGLAKLEKLEYFLRPDCNLRAIAKKTKTNATYLSKIINTHKGKNFNEYMNDLRIDYALRRLKEDRRFRSFSIKSIALEVGYKSDKSFAKHFKSKTGINPSYYIKNLENV
jgi:AraC-like DNA-binding protein